MSLLLSHPIFWYGLAFKIALTATIVVAASVVVERSGPFIGSLIAALPTAGGAALIILAIEHPPDFIAASAVGSLIANAVCAAFALTYAALAQKRSLLVSLGGAFAVWLTGAAAVAAGGLDRNRRRAAQHGGLSAGDPGRQPLPRRGRHQTRQADRRRSCLACRRGDALRYYRHRRQQLDRLLFLRRFRLLPGGDGVVLRDFALAHRRPGFGQRGGACAHAADRLRPRPAGRASAGGAGRRVVVLRGGLERRRSPGTRCCGDCASAGESNAAALLPAP